MVRKRVPEPDATDLTAETFAAAWGALRRFRPERTDSVSPWIYGIARNQYRSYARVARVERQARAKLGMRDTYFTASETEDADERLIAEEMGPQLLSALKDLSSAKREALELRVVDDLSYAEIASRMSTTEPTARTRVLRALRAMRLALGQERNQP